MNKQIKGFFVELLDLILRKELKFKGLVVKDWENLIHLHTRHRILAIPKEAIGILNYIFRERKKVLIPCYRINNGCKQ